MKRIVFTVIAFVLASVGSVQAQTPAQARPAGPPPSGNGEILGTVVDTADKAPVARASITVRTKSDSALVTGAYTGPDGTFRVQGLRSGSYYLRAVSIGFKPRNYTVDITDAAPRANVGSIPLVRIAVNLQAVQVEGATPTVVIEPDRNSYKAKDVAPAAANASDVLAATPSVEVDADGKVSLRGNENVAIQINGRPTPIRGTQLAGYLKQIPANIVERIEVVPNPSAKYDPEGMAGIINIVLKANTDLGLSGGLNTGFANASRFNVCTNLGYQAGKLTLFGTYGFNSDDRAIVGINNRERLDPSSGSSLSFTNQDIDGRNSNAGHNFSNNIDYKLTDKDVISNVLSLNRRHSDDGALAGYTELDGNEIFLERYVMDRNTKARGLVVDNSVSWKRTIEPRKHELSTELRFNRSKDDDSMLLWREPQNADGTSSGPHIQGEINATDATTSQLTAQLDYTRPLATKTKLESGLKETDRWLDREFTVFKDPLGDGNWAPSSLSNNFTFDERVHAGYGVLSQTVGKFDLQAGLRAEWASRSFDLAAQSYPHDYFSWFPSGVIMYKPGEQSQIKASYSRRIRRPGTQELNPFPVFFDQQNVFLGNPQLNPEYTDAFEFSMSKSGQLGSIQLSPFYRHTTDIIRVNINTADVVDNREVTSISFENLDKADSWGTDLNGSLRLGPKFNGFAGFNLFKMVTDGGSQSALSSNAVTWSYRLNVTSQVSPTVILQANYWYRAPVTIEKGKFNAMQMTNVTLRKKLDGDNMSVAVRFADPFNTLKFRIKAGDDNLTQITARRFGVRATYVTFQWNYGKPPKIRPPREEPAQPAPVFP